MTKWFTLGLLVATCGGGSFEALEGGDGGPEDGAGTEVGVGVDGDAAEVGAADVADAIDAAIVDTGVDGEVDADADRVPVEPGALGGFCEIDVDCEVGFCRWGVCAIGQCTSNDVCGSTALCVLVQSGRLCFRMCEDDASCVGNDRCRQVESKKVCLDPQDYPSASL